MSKVSSAVCLGAIGAFLVVSCGTRPEQAGGQPAAKGQQWEYKVLPFESIEGKGKGDFERAKKIELHSNKLGEDGWEYVGAIVDAYLVFKRPKK
jgi:hypothetical protein